MTTTLAAYATRLQAQVQARKAYEAEKNPDNQSIQKTLEGIAADLAHDAIVEVMIASNAPADFINRAERGNARFNVYAAEKVANLARYTAGAGRLNHYTRAIMDSAARFASAGVPFTHADAVASCSLDVKAPAEKEALLARYEKHIAPNTASTQASSSIAALKVMNVLTEGKGANGAVTYSFAGE